MSSESDTFTYQGKTLSREEYLGSDGLGPLGDQFLECPKCGTKLHKFSIRCYQCKAAFREIGAIESGPRGSVTKGIAFVVGLLVLATAAMVLGDHAVSEGRGVGGTVALGLAGFVFGGNGLLGVLYFRYFVGVTFLRGLAAFGAGAVSLLLGGLALVLLV